MRLADEDFSSRLIMGSSLFPSPLIWKNAAQAGDVEIATVSIRRQSPATNAGGDFWDMIKQSVRRVLPNTANSRSAKQAVLTARAARELFGTNWIKLEVIGDQDTLQPDPIELLNAARELVSDGFEVFPYCTDDLVVATRLVELGCRIVMPWAAPIGSGQGPRNLAALETLRKRLPNITLIVDAGIGKPSHAARVMELGYDAILLNTAIAHAGDPVKMAAAFALAVRAGRLAYESGTMPEREMASPSTPELGTPFWHAANVGGKGL